MRSIHVLGEAQPGRFQTGGVPLFFSGKVLIVLRTLSGLFFVGAFRKSHRPRERGKGQIGKIPEQIGKIPEKSGKSQKRTQNHCAAKRGGRLWYARNPGSKGI